MTALIGNWLGQSVVAATLVGVVIYLCRNLIETRLAKSVQHQFDRKLTVLRADLERTAKEHESIRSAAFAGLLAQRNALATKRIEAAQGLWSGVLEARKGTGVALTVELLKVPELVKKAHDPKIQEFLKAVASGDVMSSEYSARIAKIALHRPFVPANAWARFTVYSTIVFHAIATMKTLQLGGDPTKYLAVQHWSGLLNGALPKDEVDKIGTSLDYGLQWVFGRLEFHILEELRLSLAEQSAGLDSLESAQRIVDAADKWKARNAANIRAGERTGISELFRNPAE